MTLESTGSELAGQNVLAEVTALLVEVTGEDKRWAAGVEPASRLEGDLRLESVELAALGDLLARTYGDQVDIPAFVADLDIDQIVGLTVGDLVRYVLAHCPMASPAGVGGTGGTAGPGGTARPGGTNGAGR